MMSMASSAWSEKRFFTVKATVMFRCWYIRLPTIKRFIRGRRTMALPAALIRWKKVYLSPVRPALTFSR